jgi:ring-1,2-phenylacetyl-CoA epoxidase subunit PaaD
MNMPLNVKNLIDAINNIADPEVPVLTIEDLGVIRNIDVADVLTVTITPTYSGCPAMQYFENNIKTIAAEYGFENPIIKTVLHPAWTTDWLSNSGKQKLLDYGIAPPEKTSVDKGLLFSEKEKIINCPQCKSNITEMVSQFGSTACKALYKCNQCLETFDYFKCI